MQNLNAKHYKLFTADERLNLTLAAIARDDNQEVLLLQQNCPKQHYIGMDLAYRERLLAICIIQTEFSKWITHYKHKLEIIEMCIRTLCSNYDLTILLEKYQKKFNSLLNILENLNRLFEVIPKYESILKSLSIALVEFSSEINIDYKNLLALDKFNDELGNLSQYLNLDAMRNDEIVCQMKNAFSEIWEAYVVK